jgi:hypothetical protein
MDQQNQEQQPVPACEIRVDPETNTIALRCNDAAWNVLTGAQAQPTASPAPAPGEAVIGFVRPVRGR